MVLWCRSHICWEQSGDLAITRVLVLNLERAVDIILRTRSCRPIAFRRLEEAAIYAAGERNAKRPRVEHSSNPRLFIEVQRHLQDNRTRA